MSSLISQQLNAYLGSTAIDEIKFFIPLSHFKKKN